MKGMKNIDKAEVLVLKDQVTYQKGQVVSKTLARLLFPCFMIYWQYNYRY